MTDEILKHLNDLADCMEGESDIPEKAHQLRDALRVAVEVLKVLNTCEYHKVSTGDFMFETKHSEPCEKCDAIKEIAKILGMKGKNRL